MARTTHRLTDKIGGNLAAPGYHADGGGLYLQISKAGTKSWVLREADYRFDPIAEAKKSY
jgi:hypothetical protein